MKLPAPALIYIQSPEVLNLRLGCFTWKTASGFAWLEDSYLDGGVHSFHVLEGAMISDKTGIYMQLKDGHALIFSQEQVLEDPKMAIERREDFLGIQANFARLGLDWAAEYARMTEILAPELGR